MVSDKNCRRFYIALLDRLAVAAASAQKDLANVKEKDARQELQHLKAALDKMSVAVHLACHPMADDKVVEESAKFLEKLTTFENLKEWK